MHIITSNQNRIYKEVKSLNMKKGRDKLGKFYVEGYKNLEEAIRSDFRIDKILVSETETKGKEFILFTETYDRELENSEILAVNDKAFKQLSDTVTPQGIMAVVDKYEKELTPDKKGFYMVLEDIADPGNLGTIIRTADAAGINGIILTRNCVDLYNPKVIRSTMGSIFHMDVYIGYDIIDIIAVLKENGYRIYGAAGAAANTLWDTDISEPICIIIGNESSGLSQEALNTADGSISIPMPGSAESLNASMAAGIIMYEYVRNTMENK